MVGVLVAAVGILGFAGYELFFVAKPSRKMPVWDKLDENSSVAAGGPGQKSRVPCGPTEARPGVLPPELTSPASRQDSAEDQTTQEYAQNKWEDSSYCWVVVCKNHRFHHQQSQFYDHKIPLAVTDRFEVLPTVTAKLTTRCDECGKEYLYKLSEVLRYEMDAPSPFVPHPLFRD